MHTLTFIRQALSLTPTDIHDLTTGLIIGVNAIATVIGFGMMYTDRGPR